MVDFKLTQAEADALNQECLADKMRLLGRTITGVYDNALRPLGIRASQMNILVVVAKYGQASPGQVGGWLNIEKSTLSRNIERLQKQEWLEVTPAGRGHAHRLQLTGKGMSILNQGLPLWRKAQRKTRSILGDRGAKEVTRLANAIRLQRDMN